MSLSNSLLILSCCDYDDAEFPDVARVLKVALRSLDL